LQCNLNPTLSTVCAGFHLHRSMSKCCSYWIFKLNRITKPFWAYAIFSSEIQCITIQTHIIGAEHITTKGINNFATQNNWKHQIVFTSVMTYDKIIAAKLEVKRWKKIGECNSLPIYHRSGILHLKALWHEPILHDEECHSMTEIWMNRHAIWVTL
jgi:hypothetical protein